MSDLKLGNFTLEERDKFLTFKIKKYMKAHPDVSKKKARKYARHKWARKVNNAEKARTHVNTIRGLENVVK